VQGVTPEAAALPNPVDLLKSKIYIVALLFAALIGIPIAFLAFLYLAAVTKGQTWFYESLPSDLGFSHTPIWWPLPVLAVCGLIVGASIRYLPGTSGHEPSRGFVMEGSPGIADLPGVLVASLATLTMGPVLGPEAPLIALGGGLAAWAVHAVKRDAPAQAAMVIGAAGSFAAVSTLLGSPLVGAFLLMEVVGIGGPLLGVILVPGLLAAGVGSLIFIGMGNLTGLGTFSLGIPSLPSFTTVTGPEFLWAIAIGLLGALLGSAIKQGGRLLQPIVATNRLVWTPVAGLAIGVLAIIFGQHSGHSASEVLFSGEQALGALVQHASTWSVGALVALLACKGVAYAISLAGFRGGPVFPAVFLGTAVGVVMSHLPGLPLVAGVGMGIGAMTVSMLGLPLTSVLLAALLLASDATDLMPLIIVAVVVSYVASARMTPSGRVGEAEPTPVPAAT
jgi:H+/Cl- antiporter ClcA